MGEKGGIGGLVRVVRRTNKNGRGSAQPGGSSTRADVEPEPLLLTHDDDSVRRAAVGVGREAELETVLAARSTVQEVQLSADEVDAFRSQGFLAVPQMSSDAEIAVIRRIYDRLFEERAGEARGLYLETPQESHLKGEHRYPKVHQVYRLAPELLATGFMANARRVSCQLLSCDTEFLGGHAFRKPGRSPSHTPWHQDQAYHRHDLLFRNVNVWLALQETPVEAGTMEFVPGSHLPSRVFDHRRPGGHDDSSGLELADESELVDVVACPCIQAGRPSITATCCTTRPRTRPPRRVGP